MIQNKISRSMILAGALFLIAALVLWVSVFLYHQQRKDTILRTWNEQQIQIVQGAARATQSWLDYRLVENSVSRSQAVQEVLQQFIAPIRVLSSGQVWVYDSKSVIFNQRPDFPEAYHGKSIQEIFELQSALGASHYDELISAVENATEGTGWFVWSEETGKEYAAWTSVNVLNDTWTIGVSTPQREILAFAGEQQEFFNNILGISAITLLMLAAFLFTAGQHRTTQRQMEKLETTVTNRTSDLSNSEARYRQLVENLGEGIIIYDVESEKVLFANSAVRKICRCIDENALPESACLLERIVEDDRDRAHQQILNVSSDERSVSDYLAMAFDDLPIWLQITCTKIEFDGQPAAMLMLVDITERKQAEANLMESEERFAIAVAGAKDGIWDWDLRSNKLHVSTRWKAILGEQESFPIDTPQAWFSRIHPQDVDRVRSEIDSHLRGDTPQLECEYRILHRDSAYRWVQTRGIAVSEGGQKPNRIAGSMTDITARKGIEDRLRHDAMHDPLTHLPNRAYFVDQLSRLVERSRRHPEYLAAVLLLDLDRFKVINESLGHAAGDQLLIITARRLESCLRLGDLVARLGGDEFAILLDDLTEPQDAIRVAERILKDLALPFTLQSQDVFITASMGITISNQQYNRAEDLLRDSDTALYRAKSAGRARFQVFDTEMHSRSLALFQLEAELRRALERQEFENYYQPVISMNSGRIIAVEALLRWQHPVRGTILPGEFIALAEETGLIAPLGEWALRTACTQARSWADQGIRGIQVAVNLSAYQLRDPHFAKLVYKILIETGLPASLLQLEITETAAMMDLEQTVVTLRELKNMGVKIVIDDFGTSYSSLGYLKRFPVSSIKIDRSFIQDVTTDPDDAAITTAIIAMAHILELSTIAEGVETEQQLNFLAARGCDEVQGYIFSRPLPAGKMTIMLLEPRPMMPDSFEQDL